MTPGGQSAAGQWEERWHPLRREWVILAAHRQDRPWVGETVEAPAAALPPHDPSCAFCPRNTRAGGQRNDDYRKLYVFDNDHPCAGPDAPADLATPAGIYRNRPARGAARIVCYTPRHDLTLAELAVDEIESLLRCWGEQYRELGSRSEVAHVLIFENKGEVVGVSNPHPHCQIYATNFVFTTIDNEARFCREHLARQGTTLWDDILRSEREDGRRIVDENEHAIAFVPYFARWAYETFVGPKRSVPSLCELDDGERTDLAAVLRNVLVRFDNLWRMSFPYVLVPHQAPTDGSDHAGFGFHIELHPPLRKPGLLKYLAGPEIGGGSFLSDTCPEEKACELQSVSIVHYKHTGS